MVAGLRGTTRWDDPVWPARHLLVLGATVTAAFQQQLAALHPDLERYVTAFVFGTVRDRPGLDR
ncbi:MAG TPA: hypothetical protein VFI44_05725, partial [Ornithinibacter sp.]|nr:hypothetical protein [Ornithinibacter sp.]